MKKVMSKAKKAIKLGQRIIIARSVLKKIEKENDEDVLSLLNVFRRQFALQWTKEEKKELAKIEKIRKKYLESNDILKYKDFGSGNPESNRNKDQMVEGVETIRTVARAYQSSSKRKWGELIFRIVREFEPKTCLELGTCLGISAAYQLLSLKLNNHGGRLITLEGGDALAKLSNESLQSLDYPSYEIKIGRFSDTLPKVLPVESPIDLVFIDGHHDKDATREYFEQIYPYLNHKALVIFDDINWSEGMHIVWEEIYQDKRIKFSFDLFRWGICLIEKEYTKSKTKHFKMII